MPQQQQFWIEFLELYKENSCLWDVHSSSYNRRDLRNAAYNILLEKYRELDSSATMDMVKKKIDIFRTGYRRELRKIQMSREDSSPGSMEYKPTLWYYDVLSFLSFLDDEREKIATVKECNDSDDHNEDAGIEYIDIPTDYTFPNPVVKYRLKKRRLESNKPSRSRIDVTPSATYFQEEDDCSSYCDSLRLQLRELDTEQKYIAQKLISDVIFLARTSQLTLDSSIST